MAIISDNSIPEKNYLGVSQPILGTEASANNDLSGEFLAERESVDLTPAQIARQQIEAEANAVELPNVPLEEPSSGVMSVAKDIGMGILETPKQIVGGFLEATAEAAELLEGIIPLEGAKVRARSWFIIRKDYTNEDGHFQTGKTLTDVTYSIKWENRYYDIRDGALPQAYFRGPKNRDPWNLDIVSGKSLRFATIHRAAYRYNYKNIGGLKRPNIWTRLKIVYKDGEGTGVNWGTHWQRFVLAPAGIQLFPNIKLWGKRDHPTLGIIYRNTNDLYSTTIHELAHTSHIDLLKFGTIQYIATSGIMRESWPNAVEWHITKIEYNELGFSNYDDPNLNTLGDHMQHKKYPQTDPKNNKYTPLFIDLVDDYNQSLERYSSTLSQTNCPYGGTWDGAGCLIETAPPGETASIIGDDFYYTPVGCCSCPTSGANLTGTGCLVTHIHNKAIPFVVDFTKMYYNPIGDSEYPNDEIAGYSMPYLENYIVPVSINLTAYRIALKIVKPANVTNKKIDVFTDYFVGL